MPTPLNTAPNSDYSIVNLNPVLIVDLRRTDPYSVSLQPLWDISTFYPCTIDQFKIERVYELASKRNVPLTEYKNVFELDPDGTLKVTGFLSLISNW